MVTPISAVIWRGGIDFEAQIRREWAMRWLAPMDPGNLDDAIGISWGSNGEIIECGDLTEFGKPPGENPFIEDCEVIDDGEKLKLINLYRQEMFDWAEAMHHLVSAKDSIVNEDDFHSYERAEDFVTRCYPMP